jgi:hypothetical protein
MKKIKWLLNFSASWSGGGLTRVMATIDWFDKNGGAVFILNEKVKNKVSINKSNQYYFIKTERFKRIYDENYYMYEILIDIGKPDIYFSYGIPILKEIGIINWYHLSNALNIFTHNITLSLFIKLKMIFIRNRIYSSFKFIDLASSESEYSLDLLRSKSIKRNRSLELKILPNGFNIDIISNYLNKERLGNQNYAITIGTFTYKRIESVIKVFDSLRNLDINLNKLIIVGKKKYLSKCIINNPFVSIIEYVPRDEMVYDLLFNSEYYISASEIENSSIAVLESFLLSKSSILSSIPSHLEMIDHLHYTKFEVKNSDIEFIQTNNIQNRNELKFYSWNQVMDKMISIGNSSLIKKLK